MDENEDLNKRKTSKRSQTFEYELLSKVNYRLKGTTNLLQRGKPYWWNVGNKGYLPPCKKVYIVLVCHSKSQIFCGRYYIQGLN